MSSPLVLVIDDDPSQRELLDRMLGAAGYTIVTAADGQAGLDAIAALKPDLVILDVMMPGLNGYQTCRALKTDPVTSSVPIILLTSKSQPTDAFWATQVGADAYLVKPVQLAPLLEHIRRLVPPPS